MVLLKSPGSLPDKGRLSSGREENDWMKKKRLYKVFALLAAMVLSLSLLTGCAGKSTEAVQAQEDAETIQVYLWTNNLYEKYAPYVQSQLPDVNIEFIVGNNDLDFYKFLQQNGGLPDIITCCRFSLHDAAPLKDSLMNLATTNEAGAIYNTYLNSFKNEDGSVNYNEFARFVDWQIDNGTDAIVICGTTGESSTLDVDEHLECIKWCIEYVNGRVPVIAGTGSNSTASAIEMSKEACEYGADALLLVTPYYNKTSQAGLIAHYTAIHDATDKPIVLYNVPSRTGLNLLPETALELSKLPRINGIKEASGNLDQVAKVHELCGDALNIWSGNDDQIVPLLALGGKGVISVLSNMAPQYTHDICAKWFAGETQESLQMQLKALPLCKALFADVNPIPAKWAMNRLGWQAGACRLPLVEPSAAVQDQLETAMRDFGLL